MSKNSKESNAKSSSSSEQKNNEGADSDSAFVCNVCLEPVKNRDPVVTQCGHLYCWPCLFRWLNTHHTTCPVCKAGVTKENVIPIFIKGSSEGDPRSKVSSQEQIPNRPLGHRPEPLAGGLIGNPLNANLNQFGGGVALSPGYGYFPSLFGLQFQSFTTGGPAAGTEAARLEAEETLYLTRILYFLVTCVVLCLLLF